MSTFAFSFSAAGLIVALLAPVLLAIALFAVARIAPPALTVKGFASKPGGVFLVFLFLFACQATFSLFEFGRAAGEVARVLAMDAQFAWPAIKTLIPQTVSVVAVIGALLMFTVGRSPGALYGGVAALWISGPVADLLRAPILGIPFDVTQNFMGVSAVTIVATVYLLCSRRTSLLYGTASGRALARRCEALESPAD